MSNSSADQSPSIGLRIVFGTGDIATGVMIIILSTFLLFFYNQIVGLEGALAGLALGIAIFSDAITDPLVGSLSDSWHSKYGRRHPFMWFSALPLCISFYLLFNPIDGLSQTMLFLWLAVTATLTRTFMTFFSIPHYAFGAELAKGYADRTKVTSYAMVISSLGAAAFMIVTYGVIFAPSPNYDNGMLNADAWVSMSLLTVAIFATTIIFSTAGTQRRACEMAAAEKQASNRSQLSDVFADFNLFRDFKEVLPNHNFRVLLAAALVFGAFGSVYSSMILHMFTYFWDLLPSHLTQLAIINLVGNILFFALLQGKLAHYDKRNVCIVLSIIYVAIPAVIIGLRLLDLLPDNGHAAIAIIIVVSAGIAATGSTGKYPMQRSMLADVADEQEIVTGKRQEGMFFSVYFFCTKAAGGLGAVIGGFILSAISFPTNVEVADISPDVIYNLGIVMGPILGILGVAASFIYIPYKLSSHRLAEVQKELSELREQRANKSSDDPQNQEQQKSSDSPTNPSPA